MEESGRSKSWNEAVQGAETWAEEVGRSKSWTEELVSLVEDTRVEKAPNVDFHCVDWNPHDTNLILTGDKVVDFHWNVDDPWTVVSVSDDVETTSGGGTLQVITIGLNVVDVSYGGENGFNQAIELSAEIVANVKFILEKHLIGKYFEEFSQDTGKYIYGVDDTLKALEMGVVDILIVWENLDVNRYNLKNITTSEAIIKHLNKEEEVVQKNFRDSSTNVELEVQEKMSLLEWFANEYGKFGCTLEFVTNKSQEGSQFCRGFGGLGGIRRYQLDIRAFGELSDDELNEDSK